MENQIKKYVEKIEENSTKIDELHRDDGSVMSSPKYKGKTSVVRGGVAMTDEVLGRMRIVVRNIVKTEGADVLADELKNALSTSEIRELKNML